MMLAVMTAVLLFGILLVLLRAILGPSFYDRLLAVNVAGTYIMVLIMFIAELFHTPFFIDVALIYALLNFVTMVAFLRYFEYTHNQEEE